MMPVFENTRIPVAGPEAIAFAKKHGEDVSITEPDRYIEAYQWRGQIYIGKITPKPQIGSVPD